MRLRHSRRQRELRSAPHVRYWPAVSVRHGEFRPVHVLGQLCWLWVPRAAPEPTAARIKRLLGITAADEHPDFREVAAPPKPEPTAARILAMSPAAFLEHEILSSRHA